MFGTLRVTPHIRNHDTLIHVHIAYAQPSARQQNVVSLVGRCLTEIECLLELIKYVLAHRIRISEI